MDDIQLTRALRLQGLNAAEVARLSRRGDLEHLRRGAYAAPPEQALRRDEQHRRLVAATGPQLLDGSVVSHGSAAVLHRLPVWAGAIERVHVTRDGPGSGKLRHLVHVHQATLDAEDITVVDGIVVTTVARTVLDLARTRSMAQAVAAGDLALRNGLPRPELEQGLPRMERWPGVRAARRAVAFLDPRSESVGESVSRVRMQLDGVPAPDLQRDIVGPDGRAVARVDFYWDEHQTAGEFDGEVKYGRLLKPGETAGDVVFQEKVREDQIRDLDQQVARWIWDDCWRRGVIRDRVLRAFARRGR